MKPTDLYMVLVACNDENGNMMRQCSGIEIYPPDDCCESVFSAECLMDEDPPAFWETKHGIMFHLKTEDNRPGYVRHYRKGYPCIHGAQHVGNIFWNAYFCTEEIAKCLALDMMSIGQLLPDGEWETKAQEIGKEIARKQRERREWDAHPKLFAKV